MKRLIHWAALVAAVITAVAGLTLPAAAARAQSGFACPKIMAVCAFTEPGGQGERILLFEYEPVINPPIRSAANNTRDFWCMYEGYFFQGQRREVAPGDVVYDFGFPVRSAKRGMCPPPDSSTMPTSTANMNPRQQAPIA